VRSLYNAGSQSSFYECAVDDWNPETGKFVRKNTKQYNYGNTRNFLKYTFCLV